MAHRTKEGQKIHDRKVTETAGRLRQAGYKVKADLPGHPKPPKMRGHIPDIYATKGRKKLVREIETTNTITADKVQHQALQQAAKQSGAEFRVLKAKKKR